MAHFAEIRGSDQFTKFDYGPEINNEKYGSENPPYIELNKIKTPIAMYVGDQDIYATEESAEWAKNEIGEAVVHYEVLKDVDHTSFTVGKDMSYI